jgi:hypothetical protein
VAPDAGHDELRRAYVERALHHHPDRVPTGDPEAAATADYRMRELNAAWEVLRDPKRRAACDQTLAPAVTVAPSHATAVAAAPAPAPLHEPVDAAHGGAWWWLGPALALAVLIVGVVVAAVLQSDSEPRDGLDVQTGARYEPGMCVAVRPGPVAEIVSCDRPSSGRVVEVQHYPRPCTDGGLRAVALPAEDTTLCLEPVG